MKKYFEKDQVLYFWQQIKACFVKKETGKGLSSNDYTTSEKNKLAGIETGAQKNTVLSVNGKTGAVNIDLSQNVLTYTKQTLTSEQKQQSRANIGAGTSSFDGNYNSLANKPIIPTKTTQLENDAAFQTLAQQTAAINKAIKGLGTVFDLKGSKPTKVNLPTTDNKIGDVWFVESESVGYIWLLPSTDTTERWEKFGESVDLSGYWSKSELVEMTNGDVDEILSK